MTALRKPALPAMVEEARPMGHDAPKHSAEWANHEAACIAAREVRGRAMFCERHRASLDAWSRGERAWPWPDPKPAEQAPADEAVRSLLPGLLSDAEMKLVQRGHEQFNRGGL